MTPPADNQTRWKGDPATDDSGSGRARSNDRFMELLEPCHDNLARFIRSLTRDDEEGRDLLSETVLIALEKFDDLKDEKAFLSWLFTTALRLHRRRWRKSSRFGRYDQEEVARRPSTDPSPDTAYDVELLRTMIGRLGRKEREAILLYEIAGLPVEEIRQIQGGSLSGVKSRLARGRRKLARMMGAMTDRSDERKAEQPEPRTEHGSGGRLERETGWNESGRKDRSRSSGRDLSSELPSIRISEQ